MLQRICILICVFSLIAAIAVAQPAPAQGPPAPRSPRWFRALPGGH